MARAGVADRVLRARHARRRRDRPHRGQRAGDRAGHASSCAPAGRGTSTSATRRSSSPSSSCSPARGVGARRQRSAKVGAQRSSSTVTGPSLTSATCISAPNRPVATVAPSRRSSSTSAGRAARRVGSRGGDPARSAALAGVAVERELADDEELRADVGGGPVHHAGLVVEQPQVPQRSASFLATASSSSWVTPTRTHNPRPIRPTSSPVTRHRRLCHPLHDRTHRRMVAPPLVACTSHRGHRRRISMTRHV